MCLRYRRWGRAHQPAAGHPASGPSACHVLRWTGPFAPFPRGWTWPALHLWPGGPSPHDPWRAPVPLRPVPGGQVVAEQAWYALPERRVPGAGCLARIGPPAAGQDDRVWKHLVGARSVWEQDCRVPSQHDPRGAPARIPPVRAMPLAVQAWRARHGHYVVPVAGPSARTGRIAACLARWSALPWPVSGWHPSVAAPAFLETRCCLWMRGCHAPSLHDRRRAARERAPRWTGRVLPSPEWLVPRRFATAARQVPMRRESVASTGFS